ncbi:energy transducer TonB [Cognatilysobacter segetis]|uniref:energy transducer TonB n=1 Tax=Cognatilysobacter segetis TaxID=2492394 RepID=UPI001061E051|nr:energy transducer TonB [Lysobacter segetis]
MKGKLVLFGAVLFATQVWAGDVSSGDLRVLGPDALGAAWTPVAAVPPTYPAELAQRGISGCVTVTYTIDRDGRASNVRYLDGRASPRSPLAERVALDRFTEAAGQAVADWRFAARGDANPTLTATTLHFGEPVSDGAAACSGTSTARMLDGGRDWNWLLDAAVLRAGRAEGLASANAFGTPRAVRASDSPWNGTTQRFLGDPSIAAGGR